MSAQGKNHEADDALAASMRAALQASIASQFPMWGGLALRSLASTGTANALFRLGDELLVRVPQSESAHLAVEKELRWLPLLAPQLPLAIPVPLAQGKATDTCPHPWVVYKWRKGEDGWVRPLTDLSQAALDLASFTRALQQIDPQGGPRPGRHNASRGVPLRARDASVRACIEALGERVDGAVMTRVWEFALEQALWPEDRWIHGDMHPGNWLVAEGKLVAVIDFGLLGVGDPACDLLPAWNLLTHESRKVYREALSVDDAAWGRGMGWALSQALIALPYYWDTNQTMVQMSQRIISEILLDFDLTG